MKRCEDSSSCTRKATWSFIHNDKEGLKKIMRPKMWEDMINKDRSYCTLHKNRIEARASTKFPLNGVFEKIEE